MLAVGWTCEIRVCIRTGIMLRTYHGNAQLMATRRKDCPVGSAAYSSSSKLFSKSTGTMLTDVTKTGQSRIIRGLQADIMLPTYHGSVQPMATRRKVCPVGSTACSSSSKLFSKSTGTMLTDVTKTGQSRKIRGLQADILLPTYHGNVQPMATRSEVCPVGCAAYIGRYKLLSKSTGTMLTDVTKTGQSRKIRGLYYVANLSQQCAAHGHTQRGLPCRVYSVQQQF
jgi:hypothetical protein